MTIKPCLGQQYLDFKKTFGCHAATGSLSLYLTFFLNESVSGMQNANAAPCVAIPMGGGSGFVKPCKSSNAPKKFVYRDI